MVPGQAYAGTRIIRPDSQTILNMEEPLWRLHDPCRMMKEMEYQGFDQWIKTTHTLSHHFHDVKCQIDIAAEADLVAKFGINTNNIEEVHWEQGSMHKRKVRVMQHNVICVRIL